MDKVIEFCGYTLTDDEVEACKLLLKDIRERKERQRLIDKARMSISFEISDAIEKIGLAETKLIVRDLARELRGIADED